jgi:hypothetical protein
MASFCLLARVMECNYSPMATARIIVPVTVYRQFNFTNRIKEEIDSSWEVHPAFAMTIPGFFQKEISGARWVYSQ